MSDRWNFYSLHVNDRPASIMLDMGMAADAPVPGFPILGLVDVTMRQPRSDGHRACLPTSFALDFVRTDVPDKMSKVSIALMELAGAHGGGYDGWGCAVV